MLQLMVASWVLATLSLVLAGPYWFSLVLTGLAERLLSSQ